MRIAFSAETNNGLESTTSQHFGRCPYFIFVDLDGNKVKDVSSVANPFCKQRGPGQIPAFIWEHGVDVMLTRGMGYRAMDFFQQMGIQSVTGAKGTVRQSLDSYLNGQLSGAEPCLKSTEHHEHGHHHP